MTPTRAGHSVRVAGALNYHGGFAVGWADAAGVARASENFEGPDTFFGWTGFGISTFVYMLNVTARIFVEVVGEILGWDVTGYNLGPERGLW